MEFKKTKLEVNIYGEKFNASRPTVAQVNDLRKKSKDLDEDKQIDMMMDFLGQLGIPKETTMQMEIDHLEGLIGLLIPDKKK